MADFPHMSMQQRTSQTMAQVQSQKMSQVQIMSLNLLAMSSMDLREEAYKFMEKNPALEIKSDAFEEGVSSSTTIIANNSRFSDNTRYSTSSSSGETASNNFQAALESNADERQSLSDHLVFQLNSMHISDEEKKLCKKLIYNLDEKGFHILAPVTFLKSENPRHTEEFLNRCLCLVQNLDPVGTCTNNFSESLFVQAKFSGNAPKLALFFLESQEHFDFLNPPLIPKIQKKVSEYLDSQKKLKFNATDSEFSKDDITEEKIQSAIDFIKTLDPYPARNFGVERTNFISADIKVTKNHNQGDSEPEFIVTFAKETLPRLEISEKYKSFIKSAENAESVQKKAELKYAKDAVNSAKIFIDSVYYRNTTIFNASQEIVKAQIEFFRKGPRFLAPLRQKDIAETLKVHETTISRMANSKYISCEWGIFPISYFFTNSVAGTTEDSHSKESVKYEIAEILKAHESDKKPLSDQKISDLLAQKGIKVARRTVAKYRGELNINSSYER